MSRSDEVLAEHCLVGPDGGKGKKETLTTLTAFAYILGAARDSPFPSNIYFLSLLSISWIPGQSCRFCTLQRHTIGWLTLRPLPGLYYAFPPHCADGTMHFTTTGLRADVLEADACAGGQHNLHDLPVRAHASAPVPALSHAAASPCTPSHAGRALPSSSSTSSSAKAALNRLCGETSIMPARRVEHSRNFGPNSLAWAYAQLHVSSFSGGLEVHRAAAALWLEPCSSGARLGNALCSEQICPSLDAGCLRSCLWRSSRWRGRRRRRTW